MGGEGSKELMQDLINLWKIKETASPALILWKLQQIYNVLEDTYSVSGVTEIQNAINTIGDSGGTIFIEAGTHVIDTPIEVNGGGSIVIYGHGDNTILQADGGTTIFEITDSTSLTLKTLKIDVNDYGLLHNSKPAILVNETNDNVVAFSEVTIDGDGNYGVGIECQSNNVIVEHCNITDLDKGIYINNSNSHIITENTISGCDNYGIHADTSLYNTITTNNITSCGEHGIYLDSVTYSSISSNICNSNSDTGIYLTSSDYNTVTSNNGNTNSKNGMYVTGSSYNTISANTLSNNDSSTASTQGGLVITSNSDYNTITSNSLNGNNNSGAGTGYGLVIATSTCDENVVHGNNANSNDIDFQDSGTATSIVYYVQNADELQDAIDSIGSKSGVIHIDESLTLSSVIDIDGGGSYVIQGQGNNTQLKSGGSRKIFYITDAESVVISNVKFVTTNYTDVGNYHPNIEIDETNDNHVLISNCTFTRELNPTEGNDHARGILVNSDNVSIENCVFEGYDTSNPMNRGIHLRAGNYCRIINCRFVNVDYGVYVGDSESFYNTLDGNFFQCSQGVYTEDFRYSVILNNNFTGLSGRCLELASNSAYNTISNNIFASDYNYNCITITSASNNTISSNFFTCTFDSDVVDSYALLVRTTATKNHVKNNYFYGCQNTGTQDCWCVYLDTGVSENTVTDNKFELYDKKVFDNTTGNSNNIVEYICDNNTDIQDAIDSIGSKSGVINLPSGTISITTKIDVDGDGDYIIRGTGDSTIISIGDNQAFDITNINSFCIFENFKIDASGLTTSTIRIIEIVDCSNITIDNITIDGDNVNGYGIWTDNADDLKVRNSRFTNINIGIFLTNGSDRARILSNTFDNIYDTGMELSTNCNSGVFDSNYVVDCDNQASCNGIEVTLCSDWTISNNTFKECVTSFLSTSSANSFNFIGNHFQTEDFANMTNPHNSHIGLQSCDDNVFTNNYFEGQHISANTRYAINLNLHCDRNVFQQNRFNNIRNTGAGTYYAFRIGDSDSDDNVIKNNTFVNTDVQVTDSGTNSRIEYICTTGDEIQQAIDSIGSKSGTIKILSGTITLSASIDVDGGGDYIIEGEGVSTVIDCGGDRTAFEITSVNSLTMKNFKIDAADLTTSTREIIDVTEGSDNSVILDNITIIGDGTNGYGIELNSDNVIIRDCNISSVNVGIYILGNAEIVESSKIYSNASHGVQIDNASSERSIIQNNVIYTNTGSGISAECKYTSFSNNVCYTNTEDGIQITGSGSTGCKVSTNTCYQNKNGIYINSSYVAVVSNHCLNNAPSTADDTAGIYIHGTVATISSFCTIVANNVTNNSNGGAGDGYGILLTEDAAGRCNTNIVGGNSVNANDIEFLDDGTDNIILGDNTSYDATTWNGNVGTPTKNTIRDVIQDTIKEKGSSFPGSPNDGDFHYDTDDEAFYRYSSDAQAWIQVGGGGTDLPLIEDTAFGDSWDTVTGKAPSKNAIYDAINGKRFFRRSLITVADKTESTMTRNSAFHDYDISSIVSGATALLVNIAVRDNAATNLMMVRTNGSSSTNPDTNISVQCVVANQWSYNTGILRMDDDILEYYVTSACQYCRISILGWWK